MFLLSRSLRRDTSLWTVNSPLLRKLTVALSTTEGESAMSWNTTYSLPPKDGMLGRTRTIYWGRVYLTLGLLVLLVGGLAGIFKFIIFA